MLAYVLVATLFLLGGCMPRTLPVVTPLTTFKNEEAILNAEANAVADMFYRAGFERLKIDIYIEGERSHAYIAADRRYIVAWVFEDFKNFKDAYAMRYAIAHLTFLNAYNGKPSSPGFGNFLKATNDDELFKALAGLK